MVICQICGKELKRIDWAHVRKHGLIMSKYRLLFPQAEIVSMEWLQEKKLSQIGRIIWNKGQTKETHIGIAKISAALKGRIRTKEHCEAISRAKRGKPVVMAGWNKGLTRETSEAVAKVVDSKDRNAKIGKALKGRNITWGNKITEAKAGVPSTRSRESFSKVSKELWANPLWRDKQVKAIARGMNVHPNKPEKLIKKLLDELKPNQWRFNDGWFVLAGKIPDFVNINGVKKLIDLFGTYWHERDEEQPRKDLFRQYGYATLIVWEDELCDIDMLVLKLRNFVA